jgi:hypothetical protein
MQLLIAVTITSPWPHWATVNQTFQVTLPPEGHQPATSLKSVLEKLNLTFSIPVKLWFFKTHLSMTLKVTLG